MSFDNTGETRAAQFTRLLTEHGRALARLAAAYEPDPRDRDDLMQDIAFAIWRALPSFRARSSERTFIFRIGHNRAISHRSRSRAHSNRMTSGELVEIPDPAADAAQTVIAAEQHAALMRAVQQLTPALRETIVLNLEGLTNDEIAEVLGTTAQTVAVRLSRARDVLTGMLRHTRRGVRSDEETVL